MLSEIFSLLSMWTEQNTIVIMPRAFPGDRLPNNICYEKEAIILLDNLVAKITTVKRTEIISAAMYDGLLTSFSK
jgi:hypothetical protein